MAKKRMKSTAEQNTKKHAKMTMGKRQPTTKRLVNQSEKHDLEFYARAGYTEDVQTSRRFQVILKSHPCSSTP
jgi:hypothetical protein